MNPLGPKGEKEKRKENGNPTLPVKALHTRSVSNDKKKKKC